MKRMNFSLLLILRLRDSRIKIEGKEGLVLNLQFLVLIILICLFMVDSSLTSENIDQDNAVQNIVR